MKFGPEHYVPVLKAKRAEKKALGLLSPALKPTITPLVEIVERKTAKSLSAHLDTAFKGLADSAEGYSRCFLDAREIHSDGPSAAANVFDMAAKAGMVFTPVTGISRSSDVVAALRHGNSGVALRLTRTEFEDGGLAAGIRRFIDVHGLRVERTDLIVDLGAVDSLIVEGVAELTKSFLAEVPDHQRWRTFTISASAFPRSMGGVDRNSNDLVERAEWIAWRHKLFSRRHALERLPAFSDCAIQHPQGVEGFDPRTMQVSASVRYTVPDSWLLIKGESTRRTLPSVQFPALATQLVYGHLKAHFAGVGHCNGCRSVKASADGADGLGSLEAWRRLGTVHHITSVVRDLEALPWP